MACAASTSVGRSLGVSNLDLGRADAAGSGSEVCNGEVGVGASTVGVEEVRAGAEDVAEEGAEGTPEEAPGVLTPALLVSVFFRAPNEAVAWTGTSPSPSLSLPLPLPLPLPSLPMLFELS
eukprot:jgi/Undpi1/11172/HiC_scaffold_30.g13470.m1